MKSVFRFRKWEQTDNELPVPHPPILIFRREFFSASAEFGVFFRISLLSPAEVSASAGVSRSLSLDGFRGPGGPQWDKI